MMLQDFEEREGVIRRGMFLSEEEVVSEGVEEEEVKRVKEGRVQRHWKSPGLCLCQSDLSNFERSYSSSWE